MLDGVCYPQPNAERRISEIGSGSWPTPRANSAMSANFTENTANAKFPNLETMVARYPTPAARDWKDSNCKAERERNTPPLAVHAGGSLNPTWVEWLMNWPINWTSLEPLPKEQFDEWEHRTKGGAENLSDSGGRLLRSLWWEQDPSETPYRPQSHEQRTEQYSVVMSGLPREGAQDSQEGELRDMQNGVPAKKNQTSEVVWGIGVSEREGQIISRVAVGVKSRVDRLKALGNGQIPAVVRAAWRLLNA